MYNKKKELTMQKLHISKKSFGRKCVEYLGPKTSTLYY